MEVLKFSSLIFLLIFCNLQIFVFGARIEIPTHRDDDDNHKCDLSPLGVDALMGSQIIDQSSIRIEERGSLYTLDYYIYYRDSNGPISPFHDIPLFADKKNLIFNMVVEVPRWSNAKMEITKAERLNPIMQDRKKGKVRYVANCFPHHGYMWNYGAIPQTWENPSHIDESTQQKGDNDPIDICEIGHRVSKHGEILQVKILGVIGLIDQGETDWKLIAIDVHDPMAPHLNDIDDVELYMPGFLNATVDWFRVYKIPDGKHENKFAFNGEAKDRRFAHKILLDTHVQWRDLVEGRSNPGIIKTEAVSFPSAKNLITVEAAEKIIALTPEHAEAAPLDPKIDLWHFINLK